MRPNLKFIDSKIEEERKELFYDENENVNEDAKAVKVTSRAADDLIGNFNASIEELKRINEMEDFVELTITEKGAIYFDMLISSVTEESFSFEKKEYLDNLTASQAMLPPGTPDQMNSGQTQTSANSVFSFNSSVQQGFYDSMNLDLEKRLLNLFYSCHCVAFSNLSNLFNEYEINDILATLKNICILIHGIWILKSEFLYTKRHFHARNYMLGMLLRNHHLKKGEFCKVTHLDGFMAENMIAEICCFDKKERIWELKDVESNMSIFDEFIELIKQQNEIVELNYQRYKLIKKCIG
jgi:hypothetical protein